MNPLLSRSLGRALIGDRYRSATMVFVLSLPFCSSELIAETDNLSWSAEVYGGRYYDDMRVGTYVATSSELDHGATIIGEALFESYDNPSYEFAGIGAHILWPVGAFGEMGLVASQAWETYEFEPDIETNYETRTLGAEWELEQGPLVVAAQAGRILKDYADRKRNYFSADIYFWGEQLDWYLRGAVRRVSSESVYFMEGYRFFDMNGHAITAYAGMSTDDLDTPSPGSTDAVYAGAYAELFSTQDSTLTLWIEAAREENDTLFTIELNLAFGPGARTPYITAFGFSLD